MRDLTASLLLFLSGRSGLLARPPPPKRPPFAGPVPATDQRHVHARDTRVPAAKPIAVVAQPESAVQSGHANTAA